MSIDQQGGRERVEAHFEAWYDQAESDFRAATLNRLVAGMLPPGRILDVGCGAGGLLALLARDGRRVVGRDLSPSTIEVCRRYLAARGVQDVDLEAAGVEDLRVEPGSFDGVVALDVLEHIEDDLGAARALLDVLRPGGTAVVSMPAMSALYGPKDEAIGHWRRYDRDGFVALLERAGFEVEAVRFWNVLGVLPVWLSVRVLRRRVDESFRYGDRSGPQRLLNRVLRAWFTHVENRISPPRGLTLIGQVRRPLPQ
jgi:SAM-dependent methyltransferase